MKQDNNKNEIQVQHMSVEELQKTQVLNLSDVENAVKVEKKTSKKPAIFVGIIGLVLLLFGSSFQIMQVLKEKEENQRMIEKREAEKVKKTHINCIKNKLKNTSGTDDIYTYSYYFEDSKLVKEIKILSVEPTPGNPKGKDGVKSYFNTFKPLINSSTGYEVTSKNTDNGFVITTKIDLKELVKEEVKPIQKNNQVTKIDYEKNTFKSLILKEMKKDGYTCK